MTVLTKNPSANSGSWFNPTNAYSSNDTYALCSKNNVQHTYSDYGFSLAGNTIEKVEVGIEFYCLITESVSVALSWDGGINYTRFSEGFTLTTENIIWIDWSDVTGWTPTKLSDANFRVQIRFLLVGGGACFSPETLITMADGSKKPIKNVGLGQEVKTRERSGVVIAKTIHKSLKGYRLVRFKGVYSAPTHLIWQNNKWCALPAGLSSKVFHEVINIETDKASLFANDILFHNIQKEPWTAYLDWIPVRVTYSAAPPTGALLAQIM